MSIREISPQDIEVFSDTITNYFTATSGEKASVRSAYLLDKNDAPILWNDFHGVIGVSGDYTGTICYSAPRKMLTHILMLLGDRNYSDDSHLDLVGEIANTLAGQARRHFGEGLRISTPLTFYGRAGQVHPNSNSKPYAIPFQWRGYEAGLVINLDPSTS